MKNSATTEELSISKIKKKAKINSPFRSESAARTPRADLCILQQLIKIRLIVLPRGEAGLRKPLQNCNSVMRERSKDAWGKSTRERA